MEFPTVPKINMCIKILGIKTIFISVLGPGTVTSNFSTDGGLPLASMEFPTVPTVKGRREDPDRVSSRDV